MRSGASGQGGGNSVPGWPRPHRSGSGGADGVGGSPVRPRPRDGHRARQRPSACRDRAAGRPAGAAAGHCAVRRGAFETADFPREFPLVGAAPQDAGAAGRVRDPADRRRAKAGSAKQWRAGRHGRTTNGPIHPVCHRGRMEGGRTRLVCCHGVVSSGAGIALARGTAQRRGQRDGQRDGQRRTGNETSVGQGKGKRCADVQMTLATPGIRRSAMVLPQLSNKAATNTNAALAIEYRRTSSNAYWVQITAG